MPKTKLRNRKNLNDSSLDFLSINKLGVITNF